MKDYIELVIPMNRDWLMMLDQVALPIVRLLPADTAHFFTNDSHKILRLRIEESVFELQKKSIYELLLKQMQSDQKIKIYKQNYLLEEARFGNVKDMSVHTEMFYRASDIVVRLLQDADQIDNYETRLPYAVIAISYLFSAFSEKQVDQLSTLYMGHWMYFNEHENYHELTKFYESNYLEEVASLHTLLASLPQNIELSTMFAKWKIACLEFAKEIQSTDLIAETDYRDKSYMYKNNTLQNPKTWEVVCDHIHLLLNRFGISNEDETLVVYLCWKAMRQT